MAQLRWDQVAAPNFSGAIGGIEAANRMIGGGLGDMATALSQFGDRQALEQLARYSDAQQLQQDLQSGAFNTSNASAAALKTIMGRPANLLSNTQTQQTIDHNAAMNPLNQQLQQLRVQGAGMDLSNQAVMDPLRQADARLRTHQNYLGHTRSEADRAIDLAMGQQWDTYKLNNMLTPEATAAFVDQFVADPVAHAKARALVSGEVPGYGQAITSPSLGSIPGAGGAVDPDRLFESLVQTESNGRQFNSDGSVVTSSKGATGIAQVMPATAPEAAELAGLPWDPQRFKTDAEYNKALGKAYFNKQLQTFGNDSAKALAAYNAGPGATQKAIARANAEGKPNDWLTYLPKETQDYVPKTLGRITGQQAEAVARQANQENTVVQQAVQAADMFGDTSTANRALSAYSQDPRGLKSAQEMAVALTGEGGALRGVDINDTRKAIEQVVTELGVSPTVASAIVQESVGEGGILGVGAGRLWFDKQVIDFDKLEAKLDSIGGKRVNGKYENHGKFNTMLDTMVKNTATQNAQQSLEATNQEIAAITARIRQLEQIGSPAAMQAIAVENARLAQAQVLQQQALQGGQGIINGLIGNTAPSTPAPVITPPSLPEPVATRPSASVNTGSNNFYSRESIDARARAQAEREQNAATEAAEKAKAAALKLQEEQERMRKFRESYANSQSAWQQQLR